MRVVEETRGHFCVAGDHPSCPHWRGGGISFFGNERLRVVLCECNCHAECAAFRRRGLVGQQDFVRLCSCPAAEGVKADLSEGAQRAAQGERPNPLLVAAGLARAAAKMASAYRSQHLADDGSEVEIVMINSRSNRVADRARELAAEGRADDEAIAELVRLAGRRRHDLEVAAMFLRSDGADPEDRITDRAARLASAAFLGTPLIPPSSKEEAVISAVEALDDLDDGEVFRRMVLVEPRLADLEAAVRRGQFRAPSSEPDPATPDRRRAESLARLKAHRAVRDELTNLVGPASGATDPALRSRTVRDCLSYYLERLGDDRAGEA